MFRSFPIVHGIGLVNGMPVLVEEWVYGIPIQDLPGMMAGRSRGGVMYPLDVAVLGRQLYALLSMLEEYADDGVRCCITGRTVLLDNADGSPDGLLASRDVKLIVVDSTSPGRNPAEVLLALLDRGRSEYDMRSGPHTDVGNRGVAKKRREREMLVGLLHIGWDRGYSADVMRRMLDRWIRYHDRQRLKDDGSSPYSYWVDCRAFIPKSAAADRSHLGFSSYIIADALDVAESNLDDTASSTDESPDGSMMERLRWWLMRPRNFMAAWTACMLVYTAILFYIGWLFL